MFHITYSSVREKLKKDKRLKRLYDKLKSEVRMRNQLLLEE